MVSGVRCTLYSCLSSSLVDVLSLAVLGPWSGLAHHLSTPIAIEVVDHVLRVVGTGTNVHAQVYTPQQLSLLFRTALMPVHTIAVQIDIACLAALRVVLGIRGVPFHEEFVFAVGIHIAHRTVVGRVGTVAHGRRTLQVQLHVGLRPRRHGWRRLHHLATYLLYHGVLARSSPTHIRIASRCGQVCHYHFAIAQEVEANVVRILIAQQSPTDEHARNLSWQSHKTTAEFLHLARRGYLCRRRYGYDAHRSEQCCCKSFSHESFHFTWFSLAKIQKKDEG